MRLNQILAKNLKNLMKNRDDLPTQMSIRDAAVKNGHKLAQASVQRILAKQVHTSLDIVEQLAEVYGVDPVDLLRLATDEGGKTIIPPSYTEEKVLIAWRNLIKKDQHRVMSFMRVAIANKQTKIDASDEPTLEDQITALSPDALRLAKWLDQLPNESEKKKAYAKAMNAITKQMHAAEQNAAPALPAPAETSTEAPRAAPASRKKPATSRTDPHAQ